MNDTVGFRSATSVNGSVTKFQFVSDLGFPGAGNQVIDGVKGMNGLVSFLSEISKKAPAWAEGDKLGLPAGDRIPSGAVREGSRPKVSTSTAFLTRPTLYRRQRAFQGCFRHRREHFPCRSHCDGNLVLRVTPEVEASAGARRSSPLLKVGANAIDFAVDAIEKKPFPAGAYTTLKTSNAGNVTASNTLGSSTDVFIRLIHIEGVIPSSSVTLAWSPGSNGSRRPSQAHRRICPGLT